MSPLMNPSIRRGFSLIEVLFAVLVLGLGMLLVGVLVPKTITLQRDAVESTQALAAIEDAEAYLRARPDFNRMRTGGNRSLPIGLGTLLLDEDFSPYPEFGWEVEEYIEPLTGEMTVPADSHGDPGVFALSMSDRYWPQTGTVRMIWDFAVRRVPTNVMMEPARVQVALFVRRVDPRVRDRLGGGFVGGPSAVAVESKTGTPTLSGYDADGMTPNYAAPYVMDVVYEPGKFPGLRLAGPADAFDLAQRRLVMQAGQRVVDNLGNVYTVTGAVDEDGVPVRSPGGDVYLRVRPPVGSSVVPTGSGETWSSIHQIVYTPQIPLAVRVITLEVTDTVVNSNGTTVIR